MYVCNVTDNIKDNMKENATEYPIGNHNVCKVITKLINLFFDLMI